MAPRAIKIGDFVRLPSWDHCVLEVMDVGITSMWGTLIDIRKNKMVDVGFIVPLSANWVHSLTVAEILNTLGRNTSG